MNFASETNWYAVQSKPQQENLAAARVARLELEVFHPKVKQDQSVFGSTRVVTKPLFPGYFFARFCPALLLDAVRYAQGVLRIVGTRRLPIPLETEIIESIKERVHADGFVRLETRSFLAGDQVTIEQGPFAGWMGEVERECDAGKRVLILLEAIQTARMLVEKHWLTLTVEPR